MNEKMENATIGCRIRHNGRTHVIAEMISAANYPDFSKNEADRTDCWYIECRTLDGRTRYWRQDQDGGELLPPTSHVSDAIAVVNPNWKLRLRHYPVGGVYLEAFSEITAKWLNIKRISPTFPMPKELP